MFYIKMYSKFGPMVAGVSDTGSIRGLWFKEQKYYPCVDKVYDLNQQGIFLPHSVKIQAHLLQEELLAYQDQTRGRGGIAFDLQGTVFQKLVWKVVETISYGQTWTYGQLSQAVAERMGRDSMSAQAVGGALGRNPIAILIPCHRIIGADQTLTGYAGGLSIKRALLAHEGVEFPQQLAFEF